MTQIEKTNARLSQKYAGRFAADARASLFYLINRPQGILAYKAECAARDCQRQSATFAAHARKAITSESPQ